MNTPSFQNQVVIITGASSGIGAEMARQLAAQRAQLVLAARSADKLEAVAAACRENGAQALAVPTDVSQKSGCEQLIRKAAETYGRIDTLVNNAGVSMWARFASLDDPALIERIMAVNFMGAVYCTYYALPHLRQTRGRIAVISSLAGKIIAPGNTGYVASKYALDGFFDSLRVEVEDDGISVSIIYPGFVDTGLAGRMLDSSGQPSKGISELLRGQMDVTSAAIIILDTIARRQRHQLMTLQDKLYPWLKLIAPGIIERSVRAMMRRTGL